MKKGFHKYSWLIITIVITVFAVLANDSKADAASTYRIRINKQQNCVTIYKINDKGKYEPYKAMTCSVGWATPLGTFGLKEKIRWHELDGPVYGQYCTRITGHILFHSVWYYKKDNPATLSNRQYNKLGTTASHGCVRLCVRDSKWIYDNVPFGTPVEIYNSKNPGPLGKPDAIKLPDGWGWDPTDVTNPANPYNKKKPVIKLQKGKAGKTVIPYASSFNMLKTISAKNTTGFDSIKLVKYTIRFKESGTKKYKKVKKINTYKAGTYKVAYSLIDEIGRKASLKVTYKVKSKVKLTSIGLNRTSKTLYLGGTDEERTFKLKLNTYKPTSASIKELAFVSGNTAVATVDSKGKVTAVAPGETVITATAKDGSGLTATCKVIVKKYATGITLTAGTTAIKAGTKLALLKSLVPGDATVSGVSYSYTSSNIGVATVDANGVVYGIAPGTTVITVTCNGATANKAAIAAQIIITVTADETANNVSPSALNIK